MPMWTNPGFVVAVGVAGASIRVQASNAPTAARRESRAAAIPSEGNPLMTETRQQLSVARRLLSPDRSVVALPLVAVCALASGCALDREGSREVSSALKRHLDSAEQTADQYAQTPVAATPVVQSPQTEATTSTVPAAGARDGSVTLRGFIVEALAENPAIQAAEQTAQAKAQRIAQVTALPDPVLSTKTLPEPVRTAEGDNFFILNVKQRLPVPQKLDRAGRIALEEARIALSRLEETRLAVIADVKRAYFQLYIIDKSIEVTVGNRDLLRGLIDVARAQVASGRRGQDDVLRAQVELSNLEAELIDLRQRRVTVVARLNELMARDKTQPIGRVEDFTVRQAELRLKDLLDKAVDANPALARLKQKIERQRQSVELAKLAYWPDFTVGFEWMPMESRRAFRPSINPMTGRRPRFSRLSEDGSDNWAVTFGLTLPIWFDKNEAGIREAQHNLSASRQEYESARQRVDFDVTDSLARVQSQRELATLFDTTIIPQAQQTYRVSQASYITGKTDFLNVIDNWRKWLVFTIQYYRSLGELERSVADLEQAIGLSLPEVGAE